MKSKGLQITFLRCVKFPTEEILPRSPGYEIKGITDYLLEMC